MPGENSNENKFLPDFKGNSEAFRVFFSEHYSSLYLFAYKIVQDKELIEDTIQELFIELWMSKSQTKVISVKAYLFKALQYKLFKKFRRKRLLLVGDNYDQIDIAFTISRETLLIDEESDKEKAGKISTMLEQLTNRQREIIYLRFYHNMRYEEISELMEITYATARNLLSEAIKTLRKLLIIFLFMIFK